ncbi:MAG TPA: Do family serine endopeptidase [Planctomycetaceae bacterium]|nr:Do family serine endopeptidase [Planctomycetaceae bacterium]
MQRILSNRGWSAALVAMVCLAGAAAVIAQRNGAAPPSPEAHHAQELSEAFRSVAKHALPSIVSIETRGKAVRMAREFNLPFDDESLPEFFRNDPQLRQFFRRLPQQPQQLPPTRGMGSGFIIDASGVIMTNTHVVADADEVKVRLHDGREFVATDIKTDPRSDVAILRIGADDLKPLRLGDSDAVEIADWVLAIGSPFGLDLTVTAGIISAKGRGPGIADREDFLQTDAAINPGNSGGPLLNLRGEVIGINTAISTRSGAYDGVGFAIPSNMARWVADQLIEKGQVQRAYLGVSLQPVDTQLSKQFNVPVGQGTIVNQVMPGSPAEAAGIEVGDVIVDFASEKVTSPRNLQGIVERLQIDKPYRMTVLRDGKREQVSVTLREMPQNYTARALLGGEEQAQPDEPQPDESKFEDFGIEVQDLTPEIAQRLGAGKDVQGVVVTSVEATSPAQRAGIRPGDVIQMVGTSKVTSVDDFETALEDVSVEDGVLLFVRTGNLVRFLVVGG